VESFSSRQRRVKRFHPEPRQGRFWVRPARRSACLVEQRTGTPGHGTQNGNNIQKCREITSQVRFAYAYWLVMRKCKSHSVFVWIHQHLTNWTWWNKWRICSRRCRRCLSSQISRMRFQRIQIRVEVALNLTVLCLLLQFCFLKCFWIVV